MNKVLTLQTHLAFAAVLGLAASAQAGIFSDTFIPAPSPLWNNFSQTWTASSGHYFSTAPTNTLPTTTALPFDLTDFSVSVDVTAVCDGGIWLRSDGTNRNGILAVLGGNGYGSGLRDGNAGKSIYFHRVIDGNYSPALAQVDSVFVPGTDHSISIDVTGSSYTVSSDSVVKTTLIDTTYSSGQVGLYDFGPIGEPVKQSFSNFALSGSAVPEPTTALALIPAMFLTGRRRKA